MKKYLTVLLALAMCVCLSACGGGEKEEPEAPAEMTAEETVEEIPAELPEQPVGMPNPIVEYGSLAEINEKIGVNLMKPPVMGVTNERFSIISDEVAQYDCELNGREWTFRAGYVTDMDISGIYDENNEFCPGQDFTLYTNDYYMERFFDGDRQYTIVLKEPGDMGEDVFMDCCMELESIQKMHLDDPLVGDYQDSVSQRAYGCVERRGDTYALSFNWPDSVDSVTCWTIFDAVLEGDRLTYRGEEIGHYVYDAQGEEISGEVTAANNVGWFEIKDGTLCWTGAAQEQCRACVFEKIVY